MKSFVKKKKSPNAVQKQIFFHRWLLTKTDANHTNSIMVSGIARMLTVLDKIKNIP
jgi:hypothetical protein